MTMAPLLEVANLTKHFVTRQGTVHAVDDVSFTIAPGETVGLVGESGCGKSTLGRMIVRLIQPTSGSIYLHGEEVAHLKGAALKNFRRQVQLIFQDPFASLNPRSTVRRILEEPLIVHRLGTPDERHDKVDSLLQRVGLSPDAASQYPHEFSGGQRQRIGIARALALSPELIVCDEPVSALDVSIQAQVLNLISALKRQTGIAYLFISHDLSVIRYMADRIIVMYLGKIVEVADHDALWARPLHPYTQALNAAVPLPDPPAARRSKRIVLESDLPSPLSPPSGCRFHTRCPYVVDKCHHDVPTVREVAPGRYVACHLVTVGDDASVSAPGDRDSPPPTLSGENATPDVSTDGASQASGT